MFVHSVRIWFYAFFKIEVCLLKLKVILSKNIELCGVDLLTIAHLDL